MRSLLLLILLSTPLFSDESKIPGSRPTNQIIVSPNGPDDGGDFGPKTPGTKTSGLQEAFEAAKRHAKDLYVAGGSWTADKTTPVVYNLHETLHVPWMQNFRFDSGHAVLNYVGKTGDAVVIDSQMSCSYRFGLIVSLSDGAVVRLSPATEGPDRFRVITSTEFVFNALVGGGGAWPGGEPYNSTLDQKHRWMGVGLHLDGRPGPIDANKITVIETVGCETGLLLTGGISRNTIEETNIHLCRHHLRIGDEQDAVPCDNRIEAFVDSQGIQHSSGATIFGVRNMLTLSSRPGMTQYDLRFGPSAADNLVLLHSAGKTVDDSTSHTNRLISTAQPTPLATPPVPPSGEAIQNTNPFPIEIRILNPDTVTHWTEISPGEEATDIHAPLSPGQSFLLNPGESLRLHYTAPPTWRWKSIR